MQEEKKIVNLEIQGEGQIESEEFVSSSHGQISFHPVQAGELFFYSFHRNALLANYCKEFYSKNFLTALR